MPTWNSVQYSKFINERTQPAYDLASKINIVNPKSIVDVGCGPGNSTRVLKEFWPTAKTSGFDSSHEMLKQAKTSALEVDWFQSTVENWNPSGSYDIIFSNAVLQWVQSHDKLLPRLLDMLNDNGALAVQLPAHYNSPLHKQLIDVAKMPKWEEYTVKACNLLSLHPPSYYYDLLEPITSHVDIWETQYFHVMDDVQSILEWFRGTGLRPFLEAMPDKKSRVAFEQDVLEKYKSSYAIQKNGNVLFPFNRFFFIGYK